MNCGDSPVRCLKGDIENTLISENIISASNTYYDEWSKIIKETLQEALLTEPENVVVLQKNWYFYRKLIHVG